MTHPLYRLLPISNEKYEIVKNVVERQALPKYFCIHVLHSIVRQWQPNGPYSIQCMLHHTTLEFPLPGYIHSHAPHIFTLQPYDDIQQRQWRIDNIPDIMDNQQAFTQLIHAMKYNIAHPRDAFIGLPNTQYTNESIYHIQEISTTPFTELHTHISSAGDTINIRHNMILDQYRANSKPITILPHQHITEIIPTIQHEIHTLISGTINNAQKIAQSCSQHQQIAYIRQLTTIQHDLNSSLLQHIIACYQQYLTQYTIPSSYTTKE